MERGHPFYTEKLDERRAEQRRLLRRIDTGTVRRIGYAYDASGPANGNTPLVEAELRDLADDQRGFVGDDLLTAMRVAELAEPMANLLAADPGLRASGPIQPDVRLTRKPYEKARHTSPLDGLADDSRFAALLRMVLFLVWADDLADDDYRDPRVVQARERRR